MSTVRGLGGTRYSEREVTSALLDQPPYGGEPARLIICSTPRSGSYLLCRYLINAGLGIPHEYFNPISMRAIAPRLGLAAAVERLRWRPISLRDRLPLKPRERMAEVGFLETYLQRLVPIRCQSGIFAAKIHFDQYRKVLDNPVGQRLLNGSVFVHLYRENLLGQALSAHFSNLTGRWSIDGTVSTKPVQAPDFFDLARIDALVRSIAEDDFGWRTLLARNGLSPLSVSYEQFCANPRLVVEAVANRLGVDPAAVPNDYVEAIGSHDEADVSLPSKSEVAKRYLAAVRTLTPRSDVRAAQVLVQQPLRSKGVAG